MKTRPQLTEPGVYKHPCEANSPPDPLNGKTPNPAWAEGGTRRKLWPLFWRLTFPSMSHLGSFGSVFSLQFPSSSFLLITLMRFPHTVPFPHTILVIASQFSLQIPDLYPDLEYQPFYLFYFQSVLNLREELLALWWPIHSTAYYPKLHHLRACWT